MESLFIIGAMWLILLVTGVSMLLTRAFKLQEVVLKFGAGVETLRGRPVEGWMILLIACGLLASLLVAWFLGRVLGLGDMEPNRMMLFSAGFQVVIGYGIFLWILHVIRSRTPGGLSPLFGAVSAESGESSFSRGLRYYLMAIPGIALAAIAYFQLLESVGVPRVQQPIIEMFSGLESPIWILAMAVFAVALAPIVEELIFRGILLPLLIGRIGLVAGLVVSSLLFAFLHGHVQTMFPLVVVAVFFSFGYIFGQSIWVPVVMHGCFNGMNLLTLFLQKGLS